MAKGSNYTSERAFFTDSVSGLRVTRLSHYACISTNLYFEMTSFTEDDAHVVFISQRGAGRDAPWDLFRVQTDGMALVQMTERDDLRGIVVCPAIGKVLFQSEGALFGMDMLSLEEESIAEIPGVVCRTHGYSLATIDRAGTTYFGNCLDPKGGEVIFKVDTASGGVDPLLHAEAVNHLHVDPECKTLHFNMLNGYEGRAYLMDTDGGRVRQSGFERFAHHTWFGTTGKMQGTLLPPGKALAIRGERDPEPEILVEGRYYWHSSCSADAEWIVSDTNWPQEGLFLLHVPTGRVTYVCDPRSSCCHPQWTHPHPSLSPGLRYVLFNSDLTGVGQVYLVELTDEFLAAARQPR